MRHSDRVLREAMTHTACTHEAGFQAVIDTMQDYAGRCSDEGLERLLTAIRDLKYEREEMDANHKWRERMRLEKRKAKATDEGWTALEPTGNNSNDFFSLNGYPPGVTSGEKQQVILLEEKGWI